MQTITTIGFDIAKSVFQVHGVDAGGQVVIRRQLKRRYVLAFFQKLSPCLVGIEACASAHHWSRELQALGHTVRLIPPAYVKPYVKRQKNDAADAEAISTPSGPRPMPRWSLTFVTSCAWARSPLCCSTIPTKGVLFSPSRTLTTCCESSGLATTRWTSRHEAPAPIAQQTEPAAAGVSCEAAEAVTEHQPVRSIHVGNRGSCNAYPGGNCHHPADQSAGR